MRGHFKRIQFTPDLVPADLVGTRIYNQKTGEFGTSLGPVFANLLLADEINRAPAKVQSALLEVMQERQVTIGGETHRVPEPFLVMATQNPIETEGTYPLPEAQVDRFMMKVLVDYPDRRGGVRHRRARDGRCCRRSQPVATTEQLLGAAARVPEKVYVDPVPDPVRGAAGGGHARPGASGSRTGAHHVRRQPARLDQPDRGGAGARLPARPRLCAARRRGRHAADVLRHRWCCPTKRCPKASPRRSGARDHGQSRAARRRRKLAASAKRHDRAAPSACRRSERPAPPRLDGDPPAGRPAAGRLPHAVPRLRAGSRRPARIPVHDDVRHIDWNVTARMQTPHVRQFIEDREITAWFLLDLSPSVDFGSGETASAVC